MALSNGVGGSDYIATITGSKVTTGGIPLAQAQQLSVGVTDAVDRLLDRGEIGNSIHSARGLAESRLAAKALAARIGR